MKIKLVAISFFIATFWTLASIHSAEKKGKNPVLLEQPQGERLLSMPEDVSVYLEVKFPGHRFPKESEFSPAMLQYYFSNLIGVHPSVAWGDFNKDKKRDYVLLLITGDTKWGPLCELIVLNGAKGDFETFRLGEIYNFKEDYVSFTNNKLYKGRFKKNGWYINWDPKKNNYIVTKS